MAQLFLTLLIWIFQWLVVLPFFFLVATPYIFLASLFHPRPYFPSIANYYKTLFHAFVEFWRNMGIWIDI
jgi:hypothetical protein